MIAVADLYTHVLVGVVVAVVLSWRLSWVTPPMVAAAAIGAVVPDLNRIELVLPAATVEATLGVAWSWTVVHRLGGTVLVLLLLVLMVPRRYRLPVTGMLAIGVMSHYALDALLWQPDGRVPRFLWPVTTYQPAFEGLYRSPDRLPAVATTVLAVAVLLVDRYVVGRESAARSG